MFTHIRNNKVLLIIIIILSVGLIVGGFTYLSDQSSVEALKDQKASLSRQLAVTTKDVKEKEAEVSDQKAESVKKVTGLDPALIASDTAEAERYFSVAFSWSDSTEYEKARQQYMESLGPNNTFTKTYLPPDTKIQTDKGELSYIDFKGIRASMGSIYIVPTVAEGSRIRYTAFVQYIMHKESSDLANIDALAKSEAIIEFTAAGDPDQSKRNITEVNANAGFSGRPEDY